MSIIPRCECNTDTLAELLELVRYIQERLDRLPVPAAKDDDDDEGTHISASRGRRWS